MIPSTSSPPPPSPCRCPTSTRTRSSPSSSSSASSAPATATSSSTTGAASRKAPTPASPTRPSSSTTPPTRARRSSSPNATSAAAAPASTPPGRSTSTASSPSSPPPSPTSSSPTPARTASSSSASAKRTSKPSSPAAPQTPQHKLTINLEAQTVTDDQGFSAHFDIDPFRKYCLLNGLDDIGLTLRHAAALDTFESAHDKEFWSHQTRNRYFEGTHRQRTARIAEPLRHSQQTRLTCEDVNALRRLYDATQSSTDQCSPNLCATDYRRKHHAP